MKKLPQILGVAGLILAVILTINRPVKAQEHQRPQHSTVVVEFSDYPLVVMPIEGATGSGPDVPEIQIGAPFVKVDAMLRDLGFTREHQAGLLYIYNR